MNITLFQYRKILFLVVGLIVFQSSVMIVAGCDACAQAAAIRQSIKDAAAALIVAGKAVSCEMTLEVVGPEDMAMIEACCSCCANNDTYCGGENSERCMRCQAHLLKNRVIDAVESDMPSRSIRENNNIVCGPCDEPRNDLACQVNLQQCEISAQLTALIECCVNTNQFVKYQNDATQRSFKKIQNEINEIEDTLDQSMGCCSVVSGLIGNLGDPAIPVPPCSQASNIVNVVNGTNADIISWLKSIYILLYQVYQCSCEPCVLT